MRALVYTGPHSVGIEDWDEPSSDGETLVDIAFCGLCGSDVHAYLGHDERRPAPLILGHEAAGHTRDGRRVVINPLVTCTTCAHCRAGRQNLCPDRQLISMPPRGGAFAEVARLPERNLLPLPDDLSLEKAALTEPLACGWHAVRLASQHSFTPLDQMTGDQQPVVLGGGAIGLAAGLALVAHGTPSVVICEPNRKRWPSIKKAGPFVTITPEDAQDREAPLVVDAFGGGRTRALASKVVSPGGMIIHIGLANSDEGLDTRRATLQEVTFIGTYAYTAQDFEDTLGAIQSGALGPLEFTETRPLADGGAAFADMASGNAHHPKILLAL